MANKNLPTNAFKKGDKPHLLRKNVGRPPLIPKAPELTGDKTFRHLFRTYIREKEDSWFDEDVKGDTRLERIIKKSARDLIDPSTPLQAVISTFNYLEPIPAAERDGITADVLPDYKKGLLNTLDKLNLEGHRKLDEILLDKKYLKEDSESLPSEA